MSSCRLRRAAPGSVPYWNVWKSAVRYIHWVSPPAETQTAGLARSLSMAVASSIAPSHQHKPWSTTCLTCPTDSTKQLIGPCQCYLRQQQPSADSTDSADRTWMCCLKQVGHLFLDDCTEASSDGGFHGWSYSFTGVVRLTTALQNT